MRRHPSPLALLLLLAAAVASPGPGGPGSARADDWQVTRSPFDPRLVGQLKAQLQRRPDDAATLRRLVSLYRSYRTLDQLLSELTAAANKSGDPNDALIAGHVAREHGKLDEAERLYKQALPAAGPGPSRPRGKNAPDRPAVALLLAEVALARKPPDTAAASAELQEAVKDLPDKDPRRRPALRKVADLCLLAADFAGAEKAYAELLAGTRGKDEEALRRELIEALTRGNQPREALAEWRKLQPHLAEPVRRAEAELHAGELLLATRDELGAIAAYRKALALLPRSHALRHDLYDHLVTVYRKRDDLGSLVTELEAEWPPAGRSFLEWDLLGRLYDERGDTDKATLAYREALGKNPHHIDLRRRLIAVLERSGLSAEVIKEYERLSTEAPGESRYYLELAERLEKSGQRPRALAVLRRAAARLAGDPSLHSALSDLYQRWGEAELALREAELLVRIDPRDEGNVVNLGEIYWARNRKDKADEVWRRLLTINPNRALGQARLADVYSEHNLVGQAVELYQKALKAEPQNLQLKRGLATARERMHQQREALLLWEQIFLTLSSKAPPPAKAPSPAEKAGQAAGTAPGGAGAPLASGIGDRALLLEARQHLATLVGKEPRFRHIYQEWKRRFETGLSQLQGHPGAGASAPGPHEVLALGLLLSDTSLRFGNTAEAETTLRALAPAGLLKEPALRAEVLLGLLPIYRQQHKLQEAIAALKQAVALCPERSRELYAQLAELSMQTYRDDEAVDFAEKAASDAQGEVRLGELFERKDDVPRAIAAYRRALKLDDRLFRAQMALGRLHLRAGELQEAAAVYREVTRRAPQEEMVLEAGRKAIDLHEYLGTLSELVRELGPLAHAYPQKPAYRKLLLSLYERYATPLLGPARAGDPAARAELLRLGQSGLKPLTEALVDGELTEQRIAVALLGDLQNPSAVPTLLRVAAGPGAGKEAAQGPGGGGGTGIIAALGQRTPSPASQAEVDLRVNALLGASRLMDGRSAPLLVPFAGSGEKQLRAAALYGLLSIAARGKRLGKAEVATLEAALKDPSADGKALGCLAMGQLYERQGPGPGDAQALPPRVRVPLLSFLDRGKQKDEGNDLLTAACAHALGQAQEAQAVPLLIDLLREGNEELQRQAAWALGNIGDRRAVVPLLRAVFLKQERVRQAAAAALSGPGFGAERRGAGSGGAPPGGGALATGSVAERDSDGIDVRHLLDQLSSAGPHSKDDREDRSPGPPVWQREPEGLRAALEEALTSHRDLALRTMKDLLEEQGSAPLPSSLPFWLGPLTAGLRESELGALRPLLGQLGPQLLPVLKRLMLPPGAGGATDDLSDPALRAGALEVLGRLSVLLAGSASTSRDEALEAVARAALTDPALPVRLRATSLLCSLRAPRAAAVLEKQLGSPDRRLRLGALQAAAAGRGAGVDSGLPRALLQRVARDPDGYVREAALRLLR